MRFQSAFFLCWAAAASAQAQAPARTVVLSSPQLKAALDRATGLPYEYRLLPDRAVIHGTEPGHAIGATLFQSQPHQFLNVNLKPQSAKTTAARCDFFFTAEQDGRPAASFTLRYDLRGSAVFK